MSKQETTGWIIVAVIFAILLWLLRGMSTGAQITSVQTGIVGGQQNPPTITVYPGMQGCCSS